MSVKIRIAKTAKELRDAFELRYEVYKEGEGYYQDVDSGHIIDIFDSVPDATSIIAYDGETPVGTIRFNLDSNIGTPSDESYDFSDYKQEIRETSKKNNLPEPLFASVGMLAIAEKWRNRRDVFRALFRMSSDIGRSLGVTHVIATVNEKTGSIYERLGWEILTKKIWIEAIGEHILPVVTSLDTMYKWAFGSLQDKESFLEHFSGCFKWYLMDAGTVVFNQDDMGDEAYLITNGAVDIVRKYKGTDKSLVLAKLGSGDMFGEMSLIDEAPRSATAVAINNTELIVINREMFWEKIHENPVYLRDLMQILSKRLRATDEKALLYAFAPVEERLAFFMGNLRTSAIPDRKNPNLKTAKVTMEDYALLSLVTKEEAENYAHTLEDKGEITLTKKSITFIEKSIS